MKYIFLSLLFIAQVATAQKLSSISDKTKDMKKLEGFLNVYWEEATGKLWLEINQLETEILYQQSLPAGLGSNDIGLDRGLLGDTRVIRFSKAGRKILMTEANYAFRAQTTELNEKKAVEQSFAQSVLWGFTAEAETGNSVLVDATDFLVRDAMRAANKIKNMQQGAYSFDKTRSAVYLPATKNFPLNTEIETTITLVNSDGTTGNFVKSVTPSPEAITLRMHHSFVQLPDSNYQPRVFDARSGFISTSFFDYSTPVAEPIEKHFIIRHRLQKSNPTAAVSEAVKPIVYYLDNGTPEPIRSALLEGAGWWNQAFEAAGYRNAFQVKLLPDTADPMDIRYNMINWVHRSTRGWSYGAAVVDPRTGEIIKGQVSLGSLRVRQDYLIAQGLLAPFENGVPADDRMLKMALDRLKQLSAHEVGHTIGLMHNYAASITNRASVMDYPHPLVKLNPQGGMNLSDAYDLKIGEWDKAAITWGYQDFPTEINENAALSQLLSAAEKTGLQFISDRDARAPGGMHPSAHLWDGGADPVMELTEMRKVRNKALSQFGENNIRTGMPMAMLEDVLVPIYFYHRYQLEAVTKWVGGLNYRYAMRGDGQFVTKPITKAEQLKALNAVISCLEPKFLSLPESIVQLIPPRPAGYSFNNELFRKRTGLAFDALAPAETAADLALSFLFNIERLNRMSQYEVSQNGLGVREMIGLLLAKTWKTPASGTGMEKLIQHQTSQVLLTYLLAASVNEAATFQTKAELKKVVTDLENYLKSRLKVEKDESLQGNYLLALERISSPEKAKPTLHKEIPPGAPIGCDWE